MKKLYIYMDDDDGDGDDCATKNINACTKVVFHTSIVKSQVLHGTAVNGINHP